MKGESEPFVLFLPQMEFQDSIGRFFPRELAVDLLLDRSRCSDAGAAVIARSMSSMLGIGEQKCPGDTYCGV